VIGPSPALPAPVSRDAAGWERDGAAMATRAPVPPAELEAFRRRVRAFVAEHIASGVDAWEAAGGLPREVFRALGRAGLLGLGAAVRYGGQGHGLEHNVCLVEELAAARALGVGASVVSHAIVCAPLIEAHGSAELKEEFLGPVLAGELVAGIAATEPGAGSDFRGLACRAGDRGDHWELSGEKKFITNAPIADLLLVLARAEVGTGLHGFVLLLVPTASAGCEVRAPLRTLGLRSSPLGWVRFERCRVPKRLTLGDVQGGFLYAARQLMVERLLASVGVLALGAVVLDGTIAYLRARRAYGHTLSALQVVRHALVDQAADLETLRRFGQSLCASAAAGRLEEREICMLKIRSAEVLQRLVGVCLQLHGAAAFLEEHWLARVYRDARAFGLAGGCNAMLKDLIAGYMRL
jgi:alkylation response protein AidB-like acyl-CoA dehydrogenase